MSEAKNVEIAINKYSSIIYRPRGLLSFIFITEKVEKLNSFYCSFIQSSAQILRSGISWCERTACLESLPFRGGSSGSLQAILWDAVCGFSRTASKSCVKNLLLSRRRSSILRCMSLKTKGFSRKTEALILIGGGENRTLVLSKLHINLYMLSTPLYNQPCCRARHLGPRVTSRSRTPVMRIQVHGVIPRCMTEDP